jgi:hypothetical protein
MALRLLVRTHWWNGTLPNVTLAMDQYAATMLIS